PAPCTFWAANVPAAAGRRGRATFSLGSGEAMRRILVTGAAGQIGSELVPALRARYGEDAVVASDIRQPTGPVAEGGPFEILDCRDGAALSRIAARYRIDTIYHLAAILSATAE